jgi:TetR/AcrR family transcriptional regulator, transcriptional repressor for nem operon
MGRSSDARERLLEAATKLLSERPFASIGVAEICSLAGVQKGSFYYFFESKHALGLAVIDEHWGVQQREWSRILGAAEPLATRLQNLVGLTAEIQMLALRDVGAVTGCMFGNLALEMSGQDEQIRARIQEIFDEQIGIVAAAIQEAVAAGEVTVALDPRAAAKSVVAQLEGLVLFAKLFNDPAQLDALLGNSLTLLGIEAPGREDLPPARSRTARRAGRGGEEDQDLHQGVEGS